MRMPLNVFRWLSPLPHGSMAIIYEPGAVINTFNAGLKAQFTVFDGRVKLKAKGPSTVRAFITSRHGDG